MLLLELILGEVKRFLVLIHISLNNKYKFKIIQFKDLYLYFLFLFFHK